MAKSATGQGATLEVGAGTLNQLRYESGREYDIVEPFEALYQGSPHLPKVRRIYRDISEVPPTQKYHRITAIACFEHICNLPQVVETCAGLLEPGGLLCVSIPQ